jgi:hypothetical protein
MLTVPVEKREGRKKSCSKTKTPEEVFLMESGESLLKREKEE